MTFLIPVRLNGLLQTKSIDDELEILESLFIHAILFLLFFLFFLDASELQNQYNFLAAPHTTIIPTHKKRAQDESDDRIRGE